MKSKEEIVRNWLPRYTGERLENFGKYRTRRFQGVDNPRAKVLRPAHNQIQSGWIPGVAPLGNGARKLYTL